ncbi:TetR/AcrR family transcriptional regulator [Streptomyces sp. NPDC057474]|uniref:TetR/AcrR family transcriptional regulator n=1 Tax=Streptomyces sp. NPDC057474 TaxID=3346144 RepID=UPI0036A2BDC9
MLNEREDMLRAAADFIGRRPNATQDEIARALGVGRTTLHRHFTGRAELMKTLTDMAGEKLRQAIERARPTEGDCTAAVRRLVEATAESAPYVGLLYALTQDDIETDPHPVWTEVDQAVVGLFERGQASGEFSTRMTAAWMAEAFYSLMAGALWAVESGRCAPRDFTHMVTHMLLSGVGNHGTDRQNT